MNHKPALSLKGRALRLLSMREHSRAELVQKLSRNLEEGDDLEAVLAWLTAQNFLSEERAAEAIVHRQASRYGAARVRQEMQRKGVPDELIRANVERMQDSEQERAHAVWERKFGTLPATPQERAKQMRFMASRGFSGSALQRIWQQCRENGDAAPSPSGWDSDEGESGDGM